MCALEQVGAYLSEVLDQTSARRLLFQSDPRRIARSLRVPARFGFDRAVAAAASWADRIGGIMSRIRRRSGWTRFRGTAVVGVAAFALVLAGCGGSGSKSSGGST